MSETLREENERLRVALEQATREIELVELILDPPEGRPRRAVEFLDLLDERDKLRRVREAKLRVLRGEGGSMSESQIDWKVDRDYWFAEWNKIRAERDEARAENERLRAALLRHAESWELEGFYRNAQIARAALAGEVP